jgi:hypothetical protein
LETKTPALVAALAERRFRKRLAALAVDTNAATKEGVREMSSFIIFFPSGLPNRGGDCPQVHYNRLRKNVQARQGRAGGSIDILRSDIFSIKNNSSNLSPDVFMPMYWHGSLFDFRTK